MGGGSKCVSMLRSIVVGCWLLSTAHSFTTTTISGAPLRSSDIATAARRHFGSHRHHHDGIGGFVSSPLFSPSLSVRSSSNQLTRPPVIQLSTVPPIEASGSEPSPFFHKTNGTRRRLLGLSLWVQRFLQLVIRWKSRFLQKVVVIVAAFLLLFPTGSSDATTRASPPSPSSSWSALERILKKNETQNRTGFMPPSGGASTKSISGKTATALTGTVVVLPSAGLALQRARRKDPQQNTASQTIKDGTNAPVKGNHGTIPPAPKSNTQNVKESTTTNNKDQHKNKAFVERALQKTQETRQKYDADTYFKSLQKEKHAISSALENLKKSAEEKASILSNNTKNPVPTTATTSSPVTDGAMTTLAESDADVVVNNDNNPSSNTNTELPLMTPKFIQARQQPKTAEEEATLANKYKAITDVGERAFQILLDLGMIEQTGGYDDNEEPFQ